MYSKLTRREFVAGGLGAAVTVGVGLPAPAVAAGGGGTGEGDLRALQDLLSTERVLEYAYARVLRSWSFDGSARQALELIHGHEVEHAAVLEQHIAALGSPGSAAQGAPHSALPEVTAQLSGAHTARDAVRVLTKVESLAEADYFNAVGELQSPDLALTAAQILACEAQHWSLLLNILTEGHLPEMVPDAFVRGVGQIS